MGSWNNSTYSFSQNPGYVDFYGSQQQGVSASVSGDVSVSVSGTKIAYASAAMSGSASASTVGRKVVIADPSFDGDVATFAVSVEILKGEIFVDGSVTMVASATKFAYAAASLSGSGTASIIGRKLSFASAHLGNFHIISGPSADFTSTSSRVGGAYLIDPSYLPNQADYIIVSGVSETMGLVLDALTNGDTISVAGGLTTDGEEGVFEIDYTSYDTIINEVTMFGNITSGSDIVTQNGVTDSVIGNYDLYGATLTSSAARMKEVDSALSGSLTLSATATRLPTIDIALSGSASLSSSTLAFRVINVNIDGPDADLQSIARAVISGGSFIGSDLNLTASSIKFAYAAATPSGSGSVTASGKEILYASAALDQTAFVVVVGKEVIGAEASVAISSRVVWAGFTCFNASRVGEDVSTPRTLLVIDNLPLSEHNRKMSSSVVRSFAEQRNWSATRSRYYKNANGRRTFSINWTYLPGDRVDTADLRFGRDKIQSIASDPDVHQLKLLEFDTDGETPYTEDSYEVIVTGYSENLVRRDIPNSVYLWDCNLELEEV